MAVRQSAVRQSAVRLSLVMVHSSPFASARLLPEAIVAELIGVPEIDLTLVGPLAQLSASSTDRLALESLTGDVAVLDWQSPDEIVRSLARVGFDGDRVPHANDVEATAPRTPGRRIYAFDLTRFRDLTSLHQAIGQLKSSLQVRTFSLPLGPSTVVSPSPVPSQSPSPVVEPLQPKPPPAINLDDLLDQLDDLDP